MTYFHGRDNKLELNTECDTYIPIQDFKYNSVEKLSNWLLFSLLLQ